MFGRNIIANLICVKQNNLLSNSIYIYKDNEFLLVVTQTLKTIKKLDL